jgi:hypothetical protein
MCDLEGQAVNDGTDCGDRRLATGTIRFRLRRTGGPFSQEQLLHSVIHSLVPRSVSEEDGLPAICFLALSLFSTCIADYVYDTRVRSHTPL